MRLGGVEHDQGGRPHHRGDQRQSARGWSRRATSARISSTGSTSSSSSCRRSASARTTSRCSSQHFLEKFTEESRQAARWS